ncbi:MAG: hypothetical protein R2828_11805 [Saprospiraceae bacterium]
MKKCEIVGKGGNSNAPDLPKWEPWELERKYYQELGDQILEKRHLHQHRLDISEEITLRNSTKIVREPTINGDIEATE